ncbi:hypothetical protein BpHYR1_033108, partial [Brachionus plicatilis]
ICIVPWRSLTIMKLIYSIKKNTLKFNCYSLTSLSRVREKTNFCIKRLLITNKKSHFIFANFGKVHEYLTIDCIININIFLFAFNSKKRLKRSLGRLEWRLIKLELKTHYKKLFYIFELNYFLSYPNISNRLNSFICFNLYIIKKVIFLLKTLIIVR